MKITLPTFLTHHALKLPPPTILAMTLLELSRSNHWRTRPPPARRLNTLGTRHKDNP